MDGAPLTSGGKDEQASLLAADGTANETKAAGNEKAAAAGAGVTPSGEAAGAAADNGWFADPPNIKRHDQGRGLCDYYSECGTCCMGTFCPCVTFGQQAEYTGMGSCCLCGCLYLVAAEFGLGTCLVAIVRGKMEAKLGGTDEGCYKNWWCVGCCCSPCAMCQQQRAMHAAMASGVTVVGAPGSEDMRR